ncbi:hypothetical protein GCM10009504_47160 [Pseudomonas laurentiana]|nr:hypothetical protein GCM10009504_47160 [Pseudomonas laurentiana]
MERPDCFGVNGFSSFDFVAAGYELVGDEDEFHFYEKMRFVFHHKRCHGVVFKYYFYSSEGSGCGFGFGVKPGIRLKTLLKVYLALGRSQSVKFYFSDDKSDGAVIFDEEVVVRFGQQRKRDDYVVVTIESDLDKVGVLMGVATGAVMETMNSYVLDLNDVGVARRHGFLGFSRLIKFCCLRGMQSF